MTEEPHDPSDGRAWWQLGAEAPDVEALLSPEAMAVVGGVAEEALKLFVVLRDRLTAGTPTVAAARDAAPQWNALVGQLGAAAVRAVNDLATHAASAAPSKAEHVPAQAGVPGGESARTGARVAPGESAACSYCPVCQAVALFRSVPMSTWQRVAASIIEVADAARESADFRHGGQSAPVVVTAQSESGPASGMTVLDEFLASIDEAVGGAGPSGSRPDLGVIDPALP